MTYLQILNQKHITNQIYIIAFNNLIMNKSKTFTQKNSVNKYRQKTEKLLRRLRNYHVLQTTSGNNHLNFQMQDLMT